MFTLCMSTTTMHNILILHCYNTTASLRRRSLTADEPAHPPGAAVPRVGVQSRTQRPAGALRETFP